MGEGDGRLWIERLEELGGITYKKMTISIPIVFKNETEKKTAGRAAIESMKDRSQKSQSFPFNVKVG